MIQFDEPAFNVYMDEVAGWGIEALHRAIAGPHLHHRRAHLLRLRHQGQCRLEGDARDANGGNTKRHFRRWPASRIDEVSLECINSRVPMNVLKLLDGKNVQIGVIDVATDAIETPEQVAAVIGEAMNYVPRENIVAGTNCGMAPMRRDIAYAKLAALGRGAELARRKFHRATDAALRSSRCGTAPFDSPVARSICVKVCRGGRCRSFCKLQLEASP